MPNFIKFKKSDIKTEKEKIGYSIMSFNKKFNNKLLKTFNNTANKLYNQMYLSTKQPISLIPQNYNPIETKHRMEIEDALYNEGIVALKISNNNFDNTSIYNIESKFMKREQRYMFFDLNNEKIILCPNDPKQIESMETIVANEVISKKDRDGVDVKMLKNFGIKELNKNDINIIKKEIEEQLLNLEYIGDSILAQRLVNSMDPMVKILLDKKYHKDIEAMLLMLNIKYVIMNNVFIITQNDMNQINEHITGIIHGDLIIKNDAIYDKSNNIVIENTHDFSKEPNIDFLIGNLHNEEPNLEINEQEYTK